MNVLLEKEAREKLPWAVALCLVSGAVAALRGYTFYGSPSIDMAVRSLGPLVSAFLMGASTCSSELTARRAEFLFTRPVSRRDVVLSKLIVGFIILLLAAFVSALSYRIACPGPYAEFSTLSNIGMGTGWCLLYSGTAYLLGLSSSTVVPGAAGAAMFFTIQAAAFILIFGMLRSYVDLRCWPLMQFLWPLPAFVAGISLAGSKLAMPLKLRFRRYMVVCIAGVALLAAILCLIPQKLANAFISSHAVSENITWFISPDGKYAFGRDLNYVYWLDIRSNKTTRLEDIFDDYSGTQVTVERVAWHAPNTVYRVLYKKGDWYMRAYSPGLRGRIHIHDIRMGKPGDGGYPNDLLASPDGRFAAITLSHGLNKPQDAVFVNLRSGKKLNLKAAGLSGSAIWWNTNTKFAYTDTSGNPHSVFVF